MNEIRFLTPRELKESRAFFELSLPNAFSWFIYGLAALLAAFFSWAALGRMEVIVRAQAVLQPVQNGSRSSAASARWQKNCAMAKGCEGRAPLGPSRSWIVADAPLRPNNFPVRRQIFRLHVFGLYRLRAGRRRPLLKESLHGTTRYPVSTRPAPRSSSTPRWEREKSLPEERAPLRIQDLETAWLLAARVGILPRSRLSTASREIDSLLDAISSLTQRAAAIERPLETIQARLPQDGWYESLEIQSGRHHRCGTTVARIARKSPTSSRSSSPSLETLLRSSRHGVRLDFPSSSLRIRPRHRRITSFPRRPPLRERPAPLHPGGKPGPPLLENSLGESRSQVRDDGHARIILREKPIWRYLKSWTSSMSTTRSLTLVLTCLMAAATAQAQMGLGEWEALLNATDGPYIQARESHRQALLDERAKRLKWLPTLSATPGASLSTGSQGFSLGLNLSQASPFGGSLSAGFTQNLFQKLTRSAFPTALWIAQSLPASPDSATAPSKPPPARGDRGRNSPLRREATWEAARTRASPRASKRTLMRRTSREESRWAKP
jgi:hypothetical protein